MSDHSPLLMETRLSNHFSFSKHFHFENAWLKEPDIGDVVERLWIEGQGSSLVDQVAHYGVGLYT